MAHALGAPAGERIPDGLNQPDLAGPEVRRAREDLAACFRMAARHGLEEGICNHFSAMVPGYDDLFLVNPYGYAFAELTARLRALGRRESAGAPRTIEVGDVAIDSEARRVSIKGQRVAVSPTEFALLRLLARSVGSVVDRPKILEEVWDGSQHVDPNVVEQYISYLRKKLTSHEATVAIATVRGRGYRLDLLGA